jgi:hypothetical protein
MFPAESIEVKTKQVSSNDLISSSVKPHGVLRSMPFPEAHSQQNRPSFFLQNGRTSRVKITNSKYDARMFAKNNIKRLVFLTFCG